MKRVALLVIVIACIAGAYVASQGGFAPREPRAPELEEDRERPEPDPVAPPIATTSGAAGTDRTTTSPSAPKVNGETSDPTTSALEGRVVDAGTNAALAGIEVVAASAAPPADEDGARSAPSPARSARSTTDAEGGFRIAWPADERADVTASGAEHAAARVRDVGPGTPIVLRLAPGSSLEGRVATPDGLAIEGATVEVLPIGGRGDANFVVPASVRTGPDGSFRLAGLSRMPVRVRATHPRYAAGEERGTAGEGAPLSIALVPALLATIRLRTDDGRKPVAVDAMWRTAKRTRIVTLVGPGRGPEVDVDPVTPSEPGTGLGPLKVPCESPTFAYGVMAPGYLPWSVDAVELPPRGGELMLEVGLARKPDVGSVRVERKGAGGEVLDPRGDGAGVWVQKLSGPTPWLVPSAEAGALVLDGIDAGDYLVGVFARGRAPASTEIHVDAGRERLVSLTQGQEARLTVRIAAAGDRRVRFRLLRDGKEVPAFPVDSAPPGPAADGSPPRSFVAGTEGTTLGGLEDGGYEVLISSPDLVASKTPVTVKAGATAIIEVTAQPRPDRKPR